MDRTVVVFLLPDMYKNADDVDVDMMMMTMRRVGVGTEVEIVVGIIVVHPLLLLDDDSLGSRLLLGENYDYWIIAGDNGSINVNLNVREICHEANRRQQQLQQYDHGAR